MESRFFAQPSQWARVVMVALCTVGLAAMAAGDTIILQNGQRLEGRILSQTEDSVRFEERSRMVMTLRRAQIAEIIEGDSPLTFEDQGDEAAAARDFEAAIEAYERALELGASRSRIDPKLERMRTALETRDLGEFADEYRAIEALMEERAYDRAQTRIQSLLAQVPAEHTIRPRLGVLLADVYFRRAMRMVDAVNYTGAETELQRALEAHPRHGDAALELARLNARFSRTYEQSAVLYEQLLDGESFDITEKDLNQVRYEYARLLLGMDRFKRSAELFDLVYTEDPLFNTALPGEFVSALTRLARQVRSTDRETAATALRRAVDVRPQDSDIRFRLGDVLLAMQKYDEAIEQYREVLRITPNYREANHNIAMSLLGKQEVIQARGYLERELEIAPASYDTLVTLGETNLRMGDYDQARDYFLRAREVNPNETRAVVALARSERLLGNYADARRYITEMLRIRPDDPGANLELGIISKEEKAYEESMRTLDRAVELIRNAEDLDAVTRRQMHADALLARGEVKLLTRGPATANVDFEEALRVFPDYPEAFFNIGTAYERKFNASSLLDDLHLAEENMLKARELAPRNPEFAFGLGVLYHRVLASADSENQQQHLRSAVEQYRDYLRQGGTEVTRVEGWIRELGGSS